MKANLGLCCPFAPVRRAHVDPLRRAGIDPSVSRQTAWEGQRVKLVFVEHRSSRSRSNGAVVIGCHIKYDAASEQRAALMHINETAVTTAYSVMLVMIGVAPYPLAPAAGRRRRLFFLV